ncbi:MAG: hypothetical protein VYA30_01845 [Myxococcota bacterium]|nr:hypothetical protein [Myxococcota bacterium]
MRNASILLVLSVCVLNVCYADRNWPHGEVTRAEALVFNLDSSQTMRKHIYDGRHLAPTAIPKFYPLDDNQLKAIMRWVEADDGLLERGLSKCFVPRHGFLFYNKKNQVIASLSVCFECEAFRRYPDIKKVVAPLRPTPSTIKAAMGRLHDLKVLTEQMGLPHFKAPYRASRDPNHQDITSQLSAKIIASRQELQACLGSNDTLVPHDATVVWSAGATTVTLSPASEAGRRLDKLERRCLVNQLQVLAGAVYQHPFLPTTTRITLTDVFPSKSHRPGLPANSPSSPGGP